MEQFDAIENNSVPTKRRQAIKELATLTGKFALAALPAVLIATAQTAHAQVAAPSMITALQFAQRLEYFMAAFYRRGLASGLDVPAAHLQPLNNMATNVAQHADFLSTILVDSKVTKPADNSYNLTAGGAFSQVLSNYQTYLTVAQLLEDTAVRAYKGLMLAFIGHQVYMTAGLSLHSVRARHAAAIRQMRSAAGADTKPWVSGATGNDTGLAGADAFYQGEGNTKQAGISINAPAAVAIEAFDEPLTVAEAEALLSPFNV